MKRLGIVLLSILLSLTLSMALTIYVLTSTFINRQAVLSWIEDSGVISRGIENVLEFTEDVDLDEDLKNRIGQKLEVLFVADVVKPQVDLLINDAYDWLDASEYQPFSTEIDAALYKDDLLNGIDEVVDEFYDELPVCEKKATNDSEEGEGEEDEELVLCREAGVDKDEFADEIIESLSDEDEEIFKVYELGYDAEDTETDEAFRTIHSGYRTVKLIQVLLMIASVLIGAGMVFLARTRLRGARRLARSLINILAIPVLITLVILVFLPDSFGLDRLELADAESSNAAAVNTVIDKVLSPFFREIVSDLAKTYLRVALPLLILSTGVWAFARHLVHEEDKKILKAKKKK